MRRTTFTSGPASDPASSSGLTSETNATRFPSGDQAMSPTPPSTPVTRRASPKSSGMTQSCFRPRSSGLMKAIWLPSGENLGAVSDAPCVRARCSPSGIDASMSCDRSFIDFRSIAALEYASQAPSGEIDGSPTLTSSYTCSGSIGFTADSYSTAADGQPAISSL